MSFIYEERCKMRLFIGIALPENIREQIAADAGRLKK